MSSHSLLNGAYFCTGKHHSELTEGNYWCKYFRNVCCSSFGHVQSWFFLAVERKRWLESTAEITSRCLWNWWWHFVLLMSFAIRLCTVLTKGLRHSIKVQSITSTLLFLPAPEGTNMDFNFRWSRKHFNEKVSPQLHECGWSFDKQLEEKWMSHLAMLSSAFLAVKIRNLK